MALVLCIVFLGLAASCSRITWGFIPVRAIYSSTETRVAKHYFPNDFAVREPSLVRRHQYFEKGDRPLDIEYSFTWKSGASLTEEEAAHVHRAIKLSGEGHGYEKYQQYPGWARLHVNHSVIENYIVLWLYAVAIGIALAAMFTFLVYRLFLIGFTHPVTPKAVQRAREPDAEP
ncbi:MAG: hypothetical protein K2X32_12345 [Phycisphaerales bacterium]|nr:hypothetical protein [Phycisphaerales bacterium]